MSNIRVTPSATQHPLHGAVYLFLCSQPERDGAVSYTRLAQSHISSVNSATPHAPSPHHNVRIIKDLESGGVENVFSMVVSLYVFLCRSQQEPTHLASKTAQTNNLSCLVDTESRFQRPSRGPENEIIQIVHFAFSI
jgi:hypothetical protein